MTNLRTGVAATEIGDAKIRTQEVGSIAQKFWFVEIAGHAFDRVILYADRGHSDRSDGELNALSRQGLAAGRRVSETVEAEDERAAIDLAFDMTQADFPLISGEPLACE